MGDNFQSYDFNNNSKLPSISSVKSIDFTYVNNLNSYNDVGLNINLPSSISSDFNEGNVVEEVDLSFFSESMSSFWKTLKKLRML